MTLECEASGTPILMSSHMMLATPALPQHAREVNYDVAAHFASYARVVGEVGGPEDDTMLQAAPVAGGLTARPPSIPPRKCPALPSC